jgi:1-acyl-sn-glycerol-3-phosphate acyltransferase
MQEVIKKILRVIVAFCIFIYCKIVYRIKIIGKENVPKEGALLFCGNHRTYLDPPLITVTAGRKMSFMAKEELKKSPLMRFLCYAFDGIWVKRDSKDISSLKTAMKVLKNGGCIGIFPEGTRNGMEKNDGKLKNGAAYMALKTGAQIVPIGIKGPAKPFSKNTIIYGEPLDFSQYDSKKIDKEVEEKVSETLKEKIIELSS